MYVSIYICVCVCICGGSPRVEQIEADDTAERVAEQRDAAAEARVPRAEQLVHRIQLQTDQTGFRIGRAAGLTANRTARLEQKSHRHTAAADVHNTSPAPCEAAGTVCSCAHA